jgi:hypothetical protein
MASFFCKPFDGAEWIRLVRQGPKRGAKGPADIRSVDGFEESWNADLRIGLLAAIQLVSAVIFLN